MLILLKIPLLLSNSTILRRDKSILFSRAIIIIFISILIGYGNLNFLLLNFHLGFIILFIYSQKHRITLKKLTGLTVIVLITPLILHFINFGLPYLFDNLPFILFEFNHLIQRILVFFVSKMHRVLLKIFSKKGFVEILTNICILNVIKIGLLGSLSILNIVSNLFITNCLFSLTKDFYSITLIKVVIPYVENIFTSIIKPFFNSYLSPTLCDSPEEVAKLFSELPFSNVDSNDMIIECRTSTNYKSREVLNAEFKAFRLKISLYTPSFIISMQSGHVSNIEQGEPSRGQLDKGKKRAFDNTQEEVYNKRAKIDLGNTKSTIVTREDLRGEDWDLYSIYEKINNLMEDPNYNHRTWAINKLFEDKELQKNFFNYIEVYKLTSYKDVRHTLLVHLKKNLEEELKTHNNPYSIKREDFTKDSLNFLLIHEKITKLMEKEDFNKRSKIAKLEFEPWSLRLPFYATLEALNINSCKNVFDMTIPNLRDLMWEQHYMINNKPNNITRDDFTEDGLNLESIYNKIKQSIEDGQCTKTDPINKLFPSGSQIRRDFYTKLKILDLINIKKLNNIGSIKIRTLINSLEKVVHVPSTKNNSITREDLRGEDWDLYSIYEKINNLMEDPNFDKKSRIRKLEFEPDTLRKEFYAYIKNFSLTKCQLPSYTTILSLKNSLKKELEIDD